MRLTLRTLLAYLDDTLEPSQAKLIGQKVAESDTAQELIARIKQVTRRRRLTTPPPPGPGNKVDANNVAEYLDNTLSPEELAEVEQVCLASDVHLAEMAACHQILTLVLGEPALVPPTAKQRMYGLVKGPEAIPFRKPPAPRDHDREFDDSRDRDETLRLGLNLRGGSKQRWALIGGGMVAGVLLALAIWQVLKPFGGPDRPDGNNIVQGGPKDKEKDKDKVDPNDKDKNKTDKTDKNEKKDDKEKGGTEKGGTDDKKGDGETKKKDDEKKGKIDDKKPPDKEEVTAPTRLPLEPANNEPLVVGKFLPLQNNNPSILLQLQKDKDWKRLGLNKPDVYSGRPLVSLPGAKSQIQMESGVRLTLWGYLPELWPVPPLLESRAQLHQPKRFDLDMTLSRGRIALLNTRTDRPVRVRLRFENPTHPEAKEEHFDITVHEKGSEVVVDRTFFPFTERFYKDPKHANRVGPAAMLAVAVTGGEAYFSYTDSTYRLEAPGKSGPTLVLWESFKGMSGPHNLEKLPDTLSSNPPAPPGMDLKIRADMLRARDELSNDMSGKNVDVALAEAVMGSNSPKARLAVRSFAALDDLNALLEALIQEDAMDPRKFYDVRQSAVQSLQSWISYYRDGEYRLFDMLKKKYRPGEAESLMELLHSTYYTPQNIARPETYEVLIHYLNNDLLPIRELAAWHLYRLVPAGRDIPYVGTMPAQARRAAQDRWHKLIPAGQLPPKQKEPMAK
ncbi:MAG: hypothetical protein FJ271_21645 [Planctomycetes bacterium]|nr:hypothetical protein [Planctomycetota bacterium]